MKVQTYFPEEALVAFSDFLSTGGKKYQRGGCLGSPSGAQNGGMASPLPHKASASSHTYYLVSQHMSHPDWGSVRSAQFP